MMKTQRTCLVLTLILLAVFTGRALAWDSGTHENLIVFDTGGEVLASYHLDDRTTAVTHDGGDDYTVATESYPNGASGAVTTGSAPISLSGAAALVPNTLSGTFPPPSASLPDVSIFGFDEALLGVGSHPSSGISCSPSAGTYNQTLAVTITATPGSAHVSYSLDGTNYTDTSKNEVTIYLLTTTTVYMRVQGTTGAKSAEFTIDRPGGIDPVRVDTDHDGLPDCWEIKNGLDPFVNSMNADSDGDGFSDFDEILRDTQWDPEDGGAGEYPLDSDGDGWSDKDEEWRGTNKDDVDDFPVALGLYEPERLMSGTFFQDDDELTSIPLMDFTIRNLASVPVKEDTSDASGHYGATPIRLRAGDPLVIRGQGAVHANYAVKRYIPLLKDISPEDISGETWSTPEQWQAIFMQYLRDNIVITENDFDVTPVHIQPLALLERELEIYQGLGENLFILLGTVSHAPYAGTLTDFNLLLADKGQNMNDHISDLELILTEAETCYGLKTQISAFYTSVTGTDAQSLEKQIGAFLQGEYGHYLAALMITSTYEELLDSGEPVCGAISPDSDSDGDGISNGDELILGTDPHNADSDGDTVTDGLDNCPLTPNTDQADMDHDGLGDMCDDDRDGDGVSNDDEIAVGLDPASEDSDGDGVGDYDEWVFLTTPPNQPHITSPADGTVDLAPALSITATAFDDLPGDTHTSSVWQISLDPSFADTHDLIFELDTDNPAMLTGMTVPAHILSYGGSYAVRVRYRDNTLLESPWSAAVTFTIITSSADTDADGIPDDQEIDPAADTDGDGVADESQPEDIKCVNVLVDTTIDMCFKRYLNVAYIDTVESVDPASIEDTVNRPDDLPAGLAAARIITESPGDTAEVLVVFSAPLADGTRWHRYDEITGWTDYAGQIAGPSVNTLTLELTDGGPGDSDGTVNGVIITMGGIDLALSPVTEPGDGDGGGGGGGGGGGCFILSLPNH